MKTDGLLYANETSLKWTFNVGFPSVSYEHVLLPVITKEAEDLE